LDKNLETIKKSLKKLTFLKISEDENSAKIIFKESSKIISLINVPHKITKESMLKILKISEQQIERFYKQSLYWIIVCDTKNVYDKLDETMRNIKFEDNNPLKFEISFVKDAKNITEKKINHHNYLKETDNLKASGTNGSISYPDRKDSRGIYTNGTNNEALSWRKKSDYSVNSNSNTNTNSNSNSNTNTNTNSNGNGNGNGNSNINLKEE
jgi:hypothetical protein